ncbi:MAG TPA: prepilin-type N-terminal cleavage/methylation domain-containing protein, partial [Phycisphaerae bacterium]|nr:prepilin-type N-terminal cleavage/methylation domain-containing protein [Phycisphaerae bacterium]
MPSAVSALNPSASSALKLRRAFTLVELLTVIAILAVVASIGLPALLGILSGNGQTQAAGQVSAAVQRARSLAIQLNTPVALVFFEESGFTGQTGMAYEVAAPGSVIASAVTTTFNLYPTIATQFLPSGTYVAAFSGANWSGNSGGTITASMPPSSPPFLFPNTASLLPYTIGPNTCYSNVYGAIVFNAQG